MDDGDRIRTLARPHRVEIEKVKGSRFVADAAPAADDAAALAVVERVRSAFPDATHHCWAFRFGGGRERADDDGEPRDTAGAPILRHLRGAEVTDVVVVVTRWFGGTKLGRGGLVRAYGDATAAVLADAPIVERPVTVGFTLVHDYGLTNRVAAVLAAHGAVVVDASHGAEVVQQVAVPQAAADAFVTAMAEATAGQVVPDAAGP